MEKSCNKILLEQSFLHLFFTGFSYGQVFVQVKHEVFKLTSMIQQLNVPDILLLVLYGQAMTKWPPVIDQ